MNILPEEECGEFIKVAPNTKNITDADLIKRDMKEIKKYIKSKKISTSETDRVGVNGGFNGVRKLEGNEIAIDANLKNVRAVIEACGDYELIEYSDKKSHCKFPRKFMP